MTEGHPSSGQKGSCIWQSHQVFPKSSEGYVNIVPDTCPPISITGEGTMSKLFVSTAALSLIVRDWLMIAMHCKTFLQKERKMFCGSYMFFCVAIFKLLVFKIITF